MGAAWQLWEERRRRAAQLREETKQQLRFSHFVSVQPSHEIMPISKGSLRGIYEKIAEGLPEWSPFPEQVGTSLHV
jgi:hypothetical protein